MAQVASTGNTVQPARGPPLRSSSGTAGPQPPRWAARAAAVTGATVGAAYLAAWLGGLAQRWSAAGVITMKTNMSLALVLAGAALLLLEREDVPAARRAAGAAAGAIVLLVGALTLSEHLLGLDLRIDQLLASEPSGAAATRSPNRIGPPGSISLVLLGGGLLALARKRRLAFFLGLATSIVVLVPAVGFLYGIDPLYGQAGTGIAWPTVVALLSVSAGLVLADAGAGPLALLWRDDPGGVLLRRLLPAAVAVPLVLGYLRVRAERHGVVGGATGGGLVSVALVVVLSTLLWGIARQLSAAAAERGRAEASLRESEHRYATVFDGAPFAIALTKMPEGVLVSVNDAFLKLFEYSREEVIGKTSVDLGIAAGEPRERVRAELERRGAVRDLEVVRTSRSGTRHDLSLQLDRVSMGGESFILTTIQEITERRRAQQQLAEEKERLAVTLRSIGDAVIATDVEGRVSLLNSVAEELTGWTTEEAVGRPLAEVFRIVNEETGEPATSPVDAVLREGAVVGLANHTSLVSRGGIERPIADSGAPIRDAAGNVSGVVLVFRDQTEKRRADEALRERERELRALADSMPQLAWIAQPDGYISWYNRRWYEYTGTTPEQMEGWGWQSVHDPATLADVLRRWKESLAAATAFEMEFPLRGADGRFRRFLTRGFPVKDPDGKVLRWFGTNTDVTELVEAREALREASRRKDEFLGMLSHELRNPLAPIRNSIYILEHANPIGEQAARARAVIQRQTDHLARLVDDLLDVTRIARGKIALRRERVDLCAIARRTAEDLRHLVEGRGVDFRVDLPEADVWADADETRVAQIIGNLLQNAAKFTRRGDSVTLSLRAQDGMAEIAIRDTGAGIEPALLRDLFQPFVQGGRTLARSEGGLGLGLALVKGIAELHGGSVRAESDGAGKGTTVVVRLPLADGGVADPLALKGASPAAIARRVLVVDDNVDAAESLAALVKLFGHAAEIAHDGPSAIARARAGGLDVVLCDVGLPGMSGYEVARTLRAELTGVRLVAVTGYGQADDVTAALEAGFESHVTKPPDPRKIERLLAF